MGTRRGGLGQHPVDLGQVDALLGGGRPPLVAHHRRDHRDLLAGDLAVGERGADGGQLLDHPALPDHRSRRGGGQPGVTAQPRAHRLLSVVLGRLGQIRDADGAGQLGIDPVPQPHQPGGPLQQRTGAQGVQIVGGQGVQRRGQLAHHTSHPLDQVFEAYRGVLTVPSRKRRSAAISVSMEGEWEHARSRRR
jgi:hypothetical protein